MKLMYLGLKNNLKMEVSMNYFNLLWSFFRLRKNTKKSKIDIKILQEKKLRHLLHHAYSYSDYYHKSFEEAGITQDQIDTLPLSAFPTIDKAILLDHFDRVVTATDLCQEEIRQFDEVEREQSKLFKDKYHIVHSSGSTNQASYFVYDKKAWSQMLVGIIRGALWDMSTFEVLKLLGSAPRIMYIAATDGRYGGAMAVGAGIEGLHMKQTFLDINTPLSQWIDSIQQFNPNIIIGYPSAIKILGELIEEGEVKVNISRVISCGEPLGMSLRHYVEKTFHATVVNFYGASESLALGVETDYAEGMYLFDDMNYVEVEDGTMYITSLYNYVQPLIRYKLSDQLVMKDYNIEDKYPFSKVESIVGRNEDLLWFSNEEGMRDFIHPLAVEGFCIEGLVDYQFHQTSSTQFEIIAEAPDKYSHISIEAQLKADMERILKEKNLDFVRFEIIFTDIIFPDALTGKKRLIIK